MITSAEEFVRLRTSDDPAEQKKAVWAEAPEGIWLDVIARFPEMRWWVAHNKMVPVSILSALATDADWRVRCAVASKRKLSLELFALLARDEDTSVRHTIACNARVPAEVLRGLAADHEHSVAEAARERLNT